MNTIKSVSIACAALACFGLATIASASGGGGGGGGGMSGPSSSIDPQKAYKDGIAALQAREYKKAATNFKNVLDVVPKDTNTNYLYGLALVGDQNAKDARKPLERAVKDDKAPADAWLQLGLVYLQLNDAPKAQGQLDALAAKLNACDAACGDAKRAEIKTAHDALEKAVTAAAQPATAAPASPTIGWAPPGIGEGRAAYAEAVGLINTEHYEDALASLRRAETIIGPHPDIFNYMGFASRKLGRFDSALGYYRQALAINPDHIGANEYLGELYLQMGRTDDARRQLARLDELCPYGCVQREQLVHWMMASN